MTNYEKIIKNMSVDEVAKFIDATIYCCECCIYTDTEECKLASCRSGIKKWLESESKKE